MVESGVGSVKRFPSALVIQAILASVTQVRVDGLSCLAFSVLASNYSAAALVAVLPWSGFVSYRLHDHVDCDCARFAHGITCCALNFVLVLAVLLDS